MSGSSRARREAQRILLDRDGAYAAESQRAAADRLPKLERPLFRELVAGVLRRRVTLDTILDRYLKTGVDQTNGGLVTALEIGLYEILALDGAKAHATVNECVELASRHGGRAGRAVVNGVLRRILREVERLEEIPEHPTSEILVWGDRAWRFSKSVLPRPEYNPFAYAAATEGFAPAPARLLHEELGEDRAIELMRRSNERPRLVLRASLRSPAGSGELDLEALAEELRAERPGAEISVVSDHPAPMLVTQGLGDPASLTAFREGRLTVQGPFAARVAPFVAAEKGSRLLDLCAAPGGKSAHLLDLDDSLDLVAAVTDDRGRHRTADTLERLGKRAQIEVLAEETSVPDGPFSTVLLDVPCSNAGVLSRRPEARQRLDEPGMAELDRLQSDLLDRALTTLGSAGGKVVYATCSVLPRENQRRIAAFLERHAIRGVRLEEEIEAFPGSAAEDGGYAARISVPAADSI
jgi:16S rRNA (cytosine967-C5)-methyltransferase